LDARRIPQYRLGQGGRRVRIRRSDFDAFLASVVPERAPVEPTPSIWDGEIPMPVAPERPSQIVRAAR
jgi:hypothetical protein